MERTALDLVTKAFEAIGVKSEHESTLKAERASYGFDLLCALLDSWKLDDSMAQRFDAVASCNMVANQAEYTIGGTGSDIEVTERPEGIIRAYITDGENTYPMAEVTSADYFGTYRITGNTNRPCIFMYGSGYPQGTITLYPKPSGTQQLSIVYAKPIEVPASLSSSMNYSAGFTEAIIYSLAQRLGITYNVLNESVNAIASQAREKLCISRRRQVDAMSIDPAACMQGSCGARNNYQSGMRYNINTNGYQ